MFTDSLIAVSVVVPTLNSEKSLKSCLDSLMAQDYDKKNVEFLLVDNGSTDKTIEIASTYPVRIVKEPRRGRGSAYDKGFREASNELVAFMDSDAVAPVTWLKTAVQTILKDPLVAAVHFKSLAPSDAKYFQKCVDALLSKGWGGANGAIYRKDALVKIGGFDVALPYLQEDDVRMKLINQGYKIRFIDLPVVWHYPRSNVTSYIKQCSSAGFGLFKLARIHKKTRLYEKMSANILIALFPLVPFVFLLFSPILTLISAIIVIFGFAGYALYLRKMSAKEYRSLRYILPATFLMWLSAISNFYGYVKFAFT